MIPCRINWTNLLMEDGSYFRIKDLNISRNTWIIWFIKEYKQNHWRTDNFIVLLNSVQDNFTIFPHAKKCRRDYSYFLCSNLIYYVTLKLKIILNWPRSYLISLLIWLRLNRSFKVHSAHQPINVRLYSTVCKHRFVFQWNYQNKLLKTKKLKTAT